MPNFAQLILSAPRGFVSGCKSYNTVVNDGAQADHVVEACRVSYKEDRPVNASQFGSGQVKGDHDLIEEVKVLSYIVYCFEHAAPKPTVPEMAAVLDSNTFLTRDAITGIIAGIDSVMSTKETASADEDDIPDNVFEELRKTSNFGRLSNLQWRLGVALASSTCSSLSTPYISLSFDIVDNNGSKVRCSFLYPFLVCCMHACISTQHTHA